MSNAIESEVIKCLEVIKNGGIILYPTDTIWGIGCDATNEKAVEKIINLKKRSHNKSMVVLLDSTDKLIKYVSTVNDKVMEIINTVERPTTFVYENGKNLASNVYARDGSVAIRIVKHSFCQTLISIFDKPIISTSANISNEPSPGNFSRIAQTVLDGVDYVVNLQRNTKQQSTSSRIVKVDVEGNITILRN